ncbi:acyl-CoA N-acyltransferase [Abortiporus biennis]|nr:acyl-CoA N-acyltransferase [Abortiporus biennis]
MSSHLLIRRITQPTDGELEKLASIRIESDNDLRPNFITDLTGSGTPLQREIWKAIIRAGCLAGYHFAAYFSNNPDELIGEVTFYPPGVHVMADEEQREQGWNTAAAKIFPEKLLKFVNVNVPAYNTAVTSVIDPSVKDRSWSVNTLAVLPSYRRRGIATALLREAEKLVAESHHSSIILETYGWNVQMYLGLGYQLVGSHAMGVVSEEGEQYPDLQVFKKDFSLSSDL